MEETAPATPPADSQGGKGDFLFNLGLVIALAGYLSPWPEAKGLGVGAVMLAALICILTGSGWAAVKRGPAVGGVLLPIGFIGNAFVSAAETLGENAVFFLGPWIAGLGGVLAFSGAFVNTGFKLLSVDWRANPADAQFSSSFSFYVCALVGLFLPWTSDGALGTGNWLGALTMTLVLLALLASWTGMWKSHAMKEATGKLGLVLFLAPLEGALYGFLGVAAYLMGNAGGENFTTSFWPSGVSFIGAPALVLVGSVGALVVLFKGAKAAVEMEKVRKAEERAARKASRQSSGTES